MWLGLPPHTPPLILGVRVPVPTLLIVALITGINNNIVAIIKDVKVDGTQTKSQQQTSFRTINNRIPLGGAKTEVPVRFIGGVPNAAGDDTSTYKKKGAVYGVNIFVFDENKSLIREDFVISKFLFNAIIDNCSTAVIDGQTVYEFAAGDLIVAVFREDEINWVSAGETEDGATLAAEADKLRKASGSNILEGATKS